ncbi:MAG: LamG domain-containing protein, partial [Verrucomicrobia bacterium]|nr:LamG domain-containing protein [Verrucomicrobiota bacterium]
MSIDDLRLAPPLGQSALNSLLMGLWHFDDVDWISGARPVRAAQGGSGFAFGAARPSFDSAVGSKSGRFGGGGDYVGDISTLLPVQSGDFTASLWFKTGTSQSSTMLSLADGTQYYQFRMSTGRVSFVVNDGGGEQVVSSPTTTYADSRWHAVAGVRSGNQILLYLDGERVAGALVPGLGNVGNAINLVVAKAPTANIYYVGLLDEIAVYNRALSGGEIGGYVGSGYRVGQVGVYESEILPRTEITIWDKLSWVSDGPFCKPLTASADDAGIVGIWHLDELVSPVANAVVANGLPGTVVGAGFGAVGKFGRALDFDAGSSDYVQVSDSPLLEPSPERISIEAWVYMRELDNRAIIDKSSGGNGYALQTDASGRAVFKVGSASAVGFRPMRANKWSHVAGVYDGTRLTLYVDGQVESSVAVGAGTLNAGVAYFGRSQSGGNYFDGLMDEVAIHSRALLTEEVVDHYLSGAVSLKFQARSSTNLVFTSPYVGPGGSTSTYYVVASENDIKGDITPGFYFQYRVLLETTDHRYAPDLNSIIVFASGYPLSNPTIEPTEAYGYPFPGHLIAYSHLRAANPGTDVKYQISGDSGVSPTWYYYNTSSSTWTPDDPFGPSTYDFQANTVAEIDANIDTFYGQLYNGTGGVFRFRAFMHSLGDAQTVLEWTELDASPGRIAITAPNGIENGDLAWLTQVPVDITWDHTASVTGTVTIEYSLNGGGSWTVVNSPASPATAVPVTNKTHTWNTPASETTNALVRIKLNQDATIFDVSDGLFTLREGLQIVEHNGGAPTWYIGETNTIIWRKSFLAPPALIEFSNDGLFATNIVLITPTVIGAQPLNSYIWTIPLTNQFLVSENGKLRVRPVAAGLAHYADLSDAPFVLAGGVVTSPKPGQGVKKDAPFNLQWQSAGMGPQIRIELQTAPGNPWETISAAAPNVVGSNTFVWTPTNEPTETARIRLTSLTDPRAKGLTLPFTIAAIELTSPVGDAALENAEVWLQGSTQTISWVSGGADDAVNILFSTNSGADFMVIVTNYPNINGAGTSNDYTWIVAPFPSETVRVRIEDVTEPDDLFSVSPHNFQIAGLRVVWPNGPLVQEWPKG